MKTDLVKYSLLLFALLVLQTSTSAQNDLKLELVVQTGHTNIVSSVDFSPDGKMIISGSGDGTIKLWDVELGKELRTLSGHSSYVNSVAISPDGNILASGSRDGTIKLWDVMTGKELKTLKGHNNWVQSVAFSPDGRVLASGSEDKKVILWDVLTGKELKTIDGHNIGVTSVVFSPNGKVLASGSGLMEAPTSPVPIVGEIKLWNVQTGQELKTLRGHSHGVESIAFGPHGKQIVSGSIDSSVKLWSAETGKLLRTFEGHSGRVESVAFSPDGKSIASISIEIRKREKSFSVVTGGKVKLWDVESGKEILTRSGSFWFGKAVKFSPDGKILAISVGISVKLLDVNAGKELRTLSTSNSEVRAFAFSPDGRILATGHRNSIAFWNLETGKVSRSFYRKSSLALAFSPDGKILASGDFKSVSLWDVKTGKKLRTISGHHLGVTSVVFSPDGKVLASASKDIKLWDVDSGRNLKTILINDPNGFDFFQGSFAFSPDGKALAVANASRYSFTLWDVQTGKKVRTFGRISSTFVFSPDGKIVATVIGPIIKLLDVVTGNRIKTLRGHTRSVRSIAFSPDGKVLASGSRDRTIKLWDVQTGKEINSFVRDNPNKVRKVFSVVPAFFYRRNSTLREFEAFNPDGRFQAKRVNGRLNLYQVETGELLASLIALGEKGWVIVDPEGRFDASPNAQKMMHYTYGLEVIDFGQLKEAYYEPGLLQKLLGFSKEPLRPIVPLKDVKLYPEILKHDFDSDSKKLTIKLKARGQDTKTTVSSAQLDTFMKKWSKYKPFQVPMDPKDEPLLQAALKKDPKGPWAGYFSMKFAQTRFKARNLSNVDRAALYGASLTYLKPARDILALSIKTDPDNLVLQHSLNQLGEHVALASLEAGLDFAAVKSFAEAALAKNKDTQTLDYGNTIFNENTLLGRLALREGKLDEAKKHLLAAGHTPGSPQLNSFGPDFILARELAEKGEYDTVITFLDLVARFWANPDERTRGNSKRVASDNLKKLESWKKQLRAGKVPDHRQWR